MVAIVKYFIIILRDESLKIRFLPYRQNLSSVIERTYDCVKPSITSYYNVCSPYFIYPLTGDKCQLQYVGEKVQQLNERLKKYKLGFENPFKHRQCKILSKHFSKVFCIGAECRVQVTER